MGSSIKSALSVEPAFLDKSALSALSMESALSVASALPEGSLSVKPAFQRVSLEGFVDGWWEVVMII